MIFSLSHMYIYAGSCLVIYTVLKKYVTGLITFKRMPSRNEEYEVVWSYGIFLCIEPNFISLEKTPPSLRSFKSKFANENLYFDYRI